MTSIAPTARPAARFAGLDGLRAVAVVLVVAYHLFPPALLPGGFVGVDVFFVISGFLITSLLLREQAATGSVRLARFWQRRARRLIPALALVIAVCSTLAWFVGGDVLTRLGAQVLGAATFGYNWISVAGGSGYFADAAPELFRNFWSLAVEEQFYVLWPLLFPLFLLLPRAWARTGVALVLAAASALWMGSVVMAGGDLTRAYFGTDTHAFGLLLGVALAFTLAPVLARPAASDVSERAPATGVVETDAAAGPRIELPPGWTLARPVSAGSARPDTADPARPDTADPAHAGAAGAARAGDPPSVPAATRPHWMDTRVARTVTGSAGVLALIGIVVVASLAPAGSTSSFPGALLTVSVLSAVAVTAGVWPGSWLGRALDVAPLRWIGDRSYGIYLWHWPLLVLAVAAFQGTGTTAGVPVRIGLGVLAATIAASALSYSLVEMPVRRRGFRATLSAVARRLRGGPRSRLRVLGAVTVVAAMLAGTGAAIAAAPRATTSESAVEAGRRALEAAQRDAAEQDTSQRDAAGLGAEAGPDAVGPGSRPQAEQPPADIAAKTPDIADGTGSAGPSQAGRGQADPRQADARQADPGQADAGQAGPGQAGGQADPGQADPAQAGPGATGPGATGPGPAGREARGEGPAGASAHSRATDAGIHVPGDQISAIGDSVMLASAAGLLERLPGVQVDAEVSRSMWAGVDLVGSLEANGQLRPYVVIALGTNGPVEAETLQQIATTVGPERGLVLVNAYAPRDWIPGVNAELQTFADAHHNVEIADWSGAIASHVDLLAGDQIHPGEAGGRIFADTVAAAVDAIAQARWDRRQNLAKSVAERLELTPAP